jgi:aspartyl-tRNA(Asn)/glutamyl-tRNA(Gln) amidotransferase subunit A
MSTMAEPWRLGAGELAHAYASGALTPEAVLEAVLERSAQVNPRINAVIALDIDGARAAARASAARWQRGAPLGPMDGVPLTVKDNILVKGLPATWGSRLFRAFVPEKDEEPVGRLRAGGAIILGKTNVPEFTVQGITDNALFGPTRNPWDLRTTPGGSSGGAVAAVAAGIGPLALCTDGGGSIRRPAAHAGLYGFKPSTGMVPRRDGFPAILHDFEVAGPVARSIGDIRRIMQVIAPAGDWRHADPTAQRILFVPRFGEAPVDPDLAASVAAAAGDFGRLGHQVETSPFFDLAEAIAEVWSVISRTGIGWLLAAHPGAAEIVGEAAVDMAKAARGYSAADYLQALMTIEDVRRRMDDLFAQYDAVITPSIAALAWPVGATHPDRIAGEAVGPRGHAVFTVFCNALGLPAISVPCAPAPDGSRIGFQICGRRGADNLVLSLAEMFARDTGPLPWPPLA